MMDDDIWVVSYSTGDYSDYRDWAVAWYPTEADAIAHKAAFDTVRDAAVKAERNWCDAIGPAPEEDWWYVARESFRWSSMPHRTLAAWVEKDTDAMDPRDVNPASVSRVPRGTLPLHGLEEAR